MSGDEEAVPSLRRRVPFPKDLPYVGVAAWTGPCDTWLALSLPCIDAIDVVPISAAEPWATQPRRIRGNLQAPCRMAVLPSGNLLVAEHEGKRLQELDPATGDTVRLVPTGVSVFSVAAGGGVIAAGKRDEEHTADRVMFYGMEAAVATGAMCSYGQDPGQLGDCMGVALLPNGNAVVASKPNRLVLLNPAGEELAALDVAAPGVHFVDVALAGQWLVTTTNLCKDVAWVRYGDASLTVAGVTPCDECIVGITALGADVYVLTTTNVLVF